MSFRMIVTTSGSLHTELTSEESIERVALLHTPRPEMLHFLHTDWLGSCSISSYYELRSV
jgi:hypothetical protein